MGASVEEVMQVFSNLAGATAGTPTTQNRAAAANNATQNSLAAKYQRDMEEQRKKQEKAGIFGKLGGAAGGVIGTALGGPVGGVIGSSLGSGAGTAVGGGNNPMEVAAGQAASGLAGMGASKVAGDIALLPAMDTGQKLETGRVNPMDSYGSAVYDSFVGMSPPGVQAPIAPQYPAGQKMGSKGQTLAPSILGTPVAQEHLDGLAGPRPYEVSFDGKTGNQVPNPVLRMDTSPGLNFTSDEFTQSFPYLPPPRPVEGYAQGGLVTDNEPKVVGEQGPELMIPGAGSMILPNLALRGLANVIDPTTGIMGGSTAQQAGPGEGQGQFASPAGAHQQVRAAGQMSQATGGVPQGGPAGAMMGGGMPGAQIAGTNQTVQLTPEAQRKQEIADSMRDFGSSGGLGKLAGAAQKFSNMGGFENFSVAPRVDAANIPVGLDTDRAALIKGTFDTADKQAMEERKMKLEERGQKVEQEQGQQRVDTDKRRVALEEQRLEQSGPEAEKDRAFREKLERSNQLFEGDQSTAELNNRIVLQGLDSEVRKAMNDADNRTQAGIAAGQLRMTGQHYSDLATQATDKVRQEKLSTLGKMLDEAGLAQAQRYDTGTMSYYGGDNSGNIKGIEAYLKINPELATPEVSQALEILKMVTKPDTGQETPGAVVPPLDSPGGVRDGSSFFGGE